MNTRVLILSFLLLIAFCPKSEAQAYMQDALYEQEDRIESVDAGKTYLDSRIRSLDQYGKHTAHIQRRLLKKLHQKEKKLLAGAPAQQPDIADAPGEQRSLSFDSLMSLARHPDRLYNKGSPKTSALIDSLKGIRRFIHDQSAKLSGASGLSDKAGLPADYTQKLNELQQQLRAQEQISTLIDRRSDYLKSLLSGKDIPALGSLQKDIAIGRSKIQYWRQSASDPDKAEETALEYLQGTEGFQSYLHQDQNAFGGLGNDATAADLLSLGYQTKGRLSNMLQQKFGDNLGAISRQMSSGIARYREQLHSVKEKVSEAKSGIKEARQAKEQLPHIEKPAFSNPMRGIPFWKRWETQYSFQTTRSADSRPAMLNIGASLAYKSTPKLRTGIGIAADIGMGRDWQHLELSYEGISLKAFINYEMLYGIALEGGYERSFRPRGRPYLEPMPEQTRQNENNHTVLKEAFGGQQQSLYLGLLKRYRISSKWKGIFMIGYNFLWQKYDLQSPLLVRLGWER